MRMNPADVNTILISASDNDNKRILFQLALHWASNGENVLYISKSPLQQFPKPLDGFSPEKETLKRIIFMYLPQPQDLLLKCLNIHKSVTVPRAIIVEDLDFYCGILRPESSFNVQKCAMICSALIDATSVCANKVYKTGYLIVSCSAEDAEEITNRRKLCIDLYFYNNLWNIPANSTEHYLKEVYDSILSIFA